MNSEKLDLETIIIISALVFIALTVLIGSNSNGEGFLCLAAV